VVVVQGVPPVPPLPPAPPAPPDVPPEAGPHVAAVDVTLDATDAPTRVSVAAPTNMPARVR
jgi:hypothetical protein